MFADTVRTALATPFKSLEPHLAGRAELERAAGLVRMALVGAERFVLDSDVSFAVGAMGLDDIRVLASALPMARLPFPKTWIEMEIGPALRGAGIEPDPTCPSTVGYLLEETDPVSGAFTATSVTGVTGDMSGQATPEQMRGRVYVSPVAIAVNPSSVCLARTDGTSALLFADLGAPVRDGALDLYLLGSAVKSAHANGHYDDAIAMAEHGALIRSRFVEPIMADARRSRLMKLARDAMHHNVAEMSGDFRRLVAALALINARHRAVAWQDRPHGDGKGQGDRLRGRAFLHYRAVSLKVPGDVLLRDVQGHLWGAEGPPRRRHSVVAHWCHSRTEGDPGCAHQWRATDARRFTCTACGMKRWRRDSYMRGDAGVGFVIKDRLVAQGDGLAESADLSP